MAHKGHQIGVKTLICEASCAKVCAGSWAPPRIKPKFAALYQERLVLHQDGDEIIAAIGSPLPMIAQEDLEVFLARPEALASSLSISLGNPQNASRRVDVWGRDERPKVP